VAGGTAPSIALPSAALGVAEVALLSLGTYVLVRRAARPFVSSISPEFVPAGRSSIRTKLVLAIAVPVASTAVVATVVVFRHADETAREADRALAHELAALGTLRREPPTAPVRPWALAVALCGATAVAAGLGIGAGSRAAREIVQTARSIDRLVDRRSAEATAHAPLFVELAHLSEAVDALSRRYEEIEATTESALAAREQAQRMKTQFLASMSHDLRSPLNSIIGFSELLLRGVEGPLAPSQRENVEIIKRSGEDLLRLINDILDSARIEADRIDLVRRWTPSVSLVSDTIRRARELIGEKDVELHSELQPGLPPIYVDVDRLAQALFNLLSNAVKFMSSGTIWVRAHVSEGPPGPPGQYLRIEVADTGQGIPEEHRESIFEAFRQLDAGSTRRAGGMGLGLSLAKNLVELHGGRIWLESRIGEGSVFYVAIPLTGEG
jgi:signal transduction histidine kinase